MRRVFRLGLVHLFLVCIVVPVNGQLNWVKVDDDFGGLPASVHVYRSMDSLGGKPNIAYYVEADLSDRSISFETDTTLGRRLTPYQFYTKDSLSSKKPVVVVNTTFFSFATNQNLNAVMHDGRLVSYNIHSATLRGKDTFMYRHAFAGAIGISKNRKADVAWLFTDSSRKKPFAMQQPLAHYKDSVQTLSARQLKRKLKPEGIRMRKWKMQEAVAGGPVLVQEGKISISNNEEYRFPGKALNDRHPRTAMGYTRDGRLIILVVEGRNPGKAEGASLVHLAEILRDLGCEEALNLDGGGSSCMLVNGKTTITPSDRNGQQRPVPAVFTILKK